MALFHHLYGLLGAHTPLRLHPDGFQRGNRTQTKLLIIVHQKHIPLRQHHVRLHHLGLLQIQNHMKFRSLSNLTLQGDGASHGVHYVLGDGHSQTGALRLLHPLRVLPAERVKDNFLVFLRHTDARVLYQQMGADKCIPLWRIFLIKRYLNGSLLRGKLHRISQKVDHHLVKPHTVAAHILGGYVLDGDTELLAFRLHLRLNDAHNAVHNLPEGDLVHIQGHLPALNLGHVQHIVDQPQQMPA